MRPRLALPLLLAACAAPPMTPAGDYAASYLGLYGPTNLCAGQEAVVSLSADRYGFGETACAIAGVSRAETGITDVGLSLRLAECRAEGVPVPDFTVRLLQTQAGLALTSPTASVILQRCTDL